VVDSVAVGALGKLGKWREAVGVLKAMGGDGPGKDGRPDEYVYAAAITACGKAGRPLEAVLLLAEMPTKRLLPDEVCYGAAIAALSDAASSDAVSAWGGEHSQRWGGDSDEVDDGWDGVEAAAADGKGGVMMRAHEKCLSLIQEMKENSPR
ncbi:unnamed protein product, partial [Choristocarpus tenellus]